MLPEDCISNIISLTSPKDACKSSVVSWGFKSASESDAVWERFLPKDYKDIISNSVTPILYSNKKELFFYLSQSKVLLNGGTLSFWLNKSSGKKCYIICAKELSIAWKDSTMFWNWTSLVNSRFSKVAEMLNIFCLDIQGKMHTKMLSPNTHYAAYLVFKIRTNAYGLHRAMKTAVRFTNNFSSSDECDSVFLTRTVQKGRRPVFEERTEGRLPEQRNDGWMEIYLGNFFNNKCEDEVEMLLYETSIFAGKGIEVRPIEEGS